MLVSDLKTKLILYYVVETPQYAGSLCLVRPDVFRRSGQDDNNSSNVEMESGGNPRIDCTARHPPFIIKIEIHSSCEIEYFVETHLCKLCVILRSRVLRVVCPH